MNILMVMLSGVALVNNQYINKNDFEAITGTKVVEQYRIIPKEVIQLKKAENMQKQVVAKKKATKKKVAKKKYIKKSVKKKKKIVKKTTKKKTIQTKRVRYNVGEIQSYAHQLVLEYGWSEEDYQVLVLLWYRESSWNPNAVNKKSGACGLAQANPCSKATKGTDYRSNWKTQVHWGLNYIRNRYGTPSEAWDHSQRTGWY